MTKRTRILCVAILTTILLCAAWAVAPRSVAQEIAARSLASETTQSTGELIEGYKQWIRVNPVPAVMFSQIALDCAAPRITQTKMEAGNPHRDKFITVYVNDIGRHAMMREKFPRFPKGSIIVKEKLPSKDSSAPELLTVMTKREPGYDPQNGDWEYIAFDGTGKSVQARGKLESCQACHVALKVTDYVSRNYLPYQIWKKLK
jgi:Cytochrome P460